MWLGGGTHGLSQGPPPTVPGGTPSTLPGPGGALRVTSAGAWHSCPAIAVGWGGCSAGGGVPAPLGDGAGRSVSLQQGGENPGSTRAPGQSAPLRFAHLESGAKEGGQGFAQSRAWKGSALTASRGAWRSLWVRSHSAPGSKVQGVHTQGTRPVHTHGRPHGHGRPFTSKAPYCTAAPVTEAWGPPGFAAPAVPSLSLRRVSGPGAPWEGPRKPTPSCQPGNRTKAA